VYEALKRHSLIHLIHRIDLIGLIDLIDLVDLIDLKASFALRSTTPAQKRQ
jgi:hypothetical protein